MGREREKEEEVGNEEEAVERERGREGAGEVGRGCSVVLGRGLAITNQAVISRLT